MGHAERVQGLGVETILSARTRRATPAGPKIRHLRFSFPAIGRKKLTAAVMSPFGVRTPAELAEGRRHANQPAAIERGRSGHEADFLSRSSALPGRPLEGRHLRFPDYRCSPSPAFNSEKFTNAPERGSQFESPLLQSAQGRMARCQALFSYILILVLIQESASWCPFVGQFIVEADLVVASNRGLAVTTVQYSGSRLASDIAGTSSAVRETPFQSFRPNVKHPSATR